MRPQTAACRHANTLFSKPRRFYRYRRGKRYAKQGCDYINHDVPSELPRALFPNSRAHFVAYYPPPYSGFLEKSARKRQPDAALQYKAWIRVVGDRIARDCGATGMESLIASRRAVPSPPVGIFVATRAFTSCSGVSRVVFERTHRMTTLASDTSVACGWSLEVHVAQITHGPAPSVASCIYASLANRLRLARQERVAPGSPTDRIEGTPLRGILVGGGSTELVRLVDFSPCVRAPVAGAQSGAGFCSTRTRRYDNKSPRFWDASA